MATRSTKRQSALPKLESFLTVADDLQRLALGKVLAVGLYPDRVILVNRPAGSSEPAQIEKLALLLAIRGLPKGEYTTVLTVEFPGGGMKATANPAQVTVPERGDAVNLQMAFAPFSVPKPGEFVLEAAIAGQIVRESFTVVYRDLSLVLPELALRPQPSIPSSRLDLPARAATTPRPARTIAKRKSAGKRSEKAPQ